MIQVRQLRKSFGRIGALENVGFDAPDGTITALLGANGAGKTTTLRIVAGVMKADSGTVRIDHTRPKGSPSMGQSLGALLDHQGLYPRLTAREHLAYFGRLRGLRGRGLADRVERLVAALDLTSVADRPVAGFSHGERVKVSLGCAMIHQPAHLLLDEPTNGLDVPTVRALRVFLRALRDAGTCIVFSTHVLGEVEELCDRIVVLAQGTRVAEGSLEEIRQASGGTLEDAFMNLTRRTEVVPC
jgi:sodium transport system ATP-binding protein